MVVATDVPAAALPLRLADVHRALPVGAVLELTVPAAGGTDVSGSTGANPWAGSDRTWDADRLVDVVVGAGFDQIQLAGDEDGVPGCELRVTAVRGRTLADLVGPGMAMLVCGLNPSLYAADAGVGFARPGNRFWPALRAAGLTELDRDPLGLFHTARIGTTDLVKRATVAASEVSAAEFVAGVARVERLCRWFRPRLLYLVGLQGWRSAVDRRAATGLQPAALGGVPVYLGPSTSGLNASTQLPGHVAHLRSAAALAGLPT